MSEAARDAMVDHVATREDPDESVLEALRAVPRHEFVPEKRRDSAYADRPLPIGEGQTVSAPHVVARMCDLLDVDEGDDVLEIGTGCGYHAAVTAELVGAERVYTVEYESSLAESARRRLDELGYGEVSVRTGDGREGWPEHAPYDAAYLTCAAESFPDPIVGQLRVGGVLVGPIGSAVQRLVSAEHLGDGDLDRSNHGRVRFVPLRGRAD